MTHPPPQKHLEVHGTNTLAQTWGRIPVERKAPGGRQVGDPIRDQSLDKAHRRGFCRL